MGNQLCMLPLLELIEEEYSQHEDLLRMAGFARTTHERLVQIINEVKAFVRFEREQVIAQPVGLAHVLHELVEFLRYERNLPLARLSVDINAEPWAKANRVKIQQVLLNLLKNAALAHSRLRRDRACHADGLSTAGRPGRDRGQRQRLRHDRGRRAADLGAVLYYQG